MDDDTQPGTPDETQSTPDPDEEKPASPVDGQGEDDQDDTTQTV